MKPSASLLGYVGAAWGLIGILAMLLGAIIRLAPYTWEAFEAGLLWWQWLLTFFWVVFMVWSEGERGFRQQFCPRVVARAVHLQGHRTFLRVVLAPLFCMGFFGATPRRCLIAWCTTLGIIGLVVFVKLLPQPWRGIVDAGVVLGLAWGVLWMPFFIFRGFVLQNLDTDAEIS